VALWLVGLSVFPASDLDRTSVYELEGKIQVVQTRRVLLLFALVLGVSALAASLAPPPDTSRDKPKEPPAASAPSARAVPGSPARRVRLTAPRAAAHAARAPLRRLPGGSRLVLEVSVPEPGEVAIERLGLRAAADPLTPARFELLAEPAGRFPVLFVPVRGKPRTAARLLFTRPD
jgi:hypothetical protein